MSNPVPVLFLAITAAVFSVTAVADEQASPRVVMIIGAEQEDASAPVFEAIEAQLSDLDVEFHAERIPALPVSLLEQIAVAEGAGGAPGTVCVFWFDLAEDGAVYVHLQGGADAKDRLLIRRLEPGSEGARGRAEGLAIIVRSSVAALLAGGRIGILVDEILEAASPPPASPPPPSPPPSDAQADTSGGGPGRLDLGLGYAFAAPGETHPAQHGMWLGLGLRVVAGLRIEAGYTVLEPLAARGELAAMRLHRHPLRFGLGYGMRLGPTRLGVGVHLVIEHARQEIEGLAPGMRAASDLDDVTLALAPHLSADLAVWRQLGLFLMAGIDLLLSPIDYTATRGELTEVLMTAWPVQPFLMAGLRIFLW